jgi:hypothetical protein
LLAAATFNVALVAGCASATEPPQMLAQANAVHRTMLRIDKAWLDILELPEISWMFLVLCCVIF